MPKPTIKIAQITRQISPDFSHQKRKRVKTALSSYFFIYKARNCRLIDSRFIQMISAKNGHSYPLKSPNHLKKYRNLSFWSSTPFL